MPGMLSERDHHEYRFVREAPEDSVWQAEGYTALVEFDESVLQNKPAICETSLPACGQAPHRTGPQPGHGARPGVLEHGVGLAAYQRLKLDLHTGGRAVSDVHRTEGGGEEIRGGIGFLFSAVLFLVLVVYGGLIMRSVVEEKSNRVIEVLIAAVRPEELLLGKVIGAVARLQLVAWSLLSTAAFSAFRL